MLRNEASHHYGATNIIYTVGQHFLLPFFIPFIFTMATSNDPLHGKTLQMIVTHLVEMYGWEELAKLIPINCFKSNPSINSSLKFLRKTPWARKKVEELYING
jgi:DNA-binding protein VF530